MPENRRFERGILLALLFWVGLIFCSHLHAQTLLPPTKSCFESSGVVLNGGKVFTYALGTTTPLASYTDYTLGTPNANPVILGSDGCANIWLGPSAYKIVVQKSDGSAVYTTDGVKGGYNTFLALNGSNALTAISDPAASLGLFWLSSTNVGRIKWSDASAIHTVVGADTTDTLTNKTLNQPLIVGVTDGSAAATGNVGEFVRTKQATPQSLSTGTILSLGSISLTAGDWDIQANAVFSGNSTTITFAAVAISTSAVAIAPADNSFENEAATSLITGTAISSGHGMATPTFRVSISTTTSYFLLTQATFGSNAVSVAGTLRARRVR